MTSIRDSIQIGPIRFGSRIILAPMDGYSDNPFRLLTRRLGSGASFTEFINTIEVMSKNTKYQDRCHFAPEERPVAIQIFDDNVDRLIAGGNRVYELFKPDLIDVNMGCSVNHVSNRGASAGLLRRPDKVEQIISGLVNSLPCPVSAKIRLGWDADVVEVFQKQVFDTVITRTVRFPETSVAGEPIITWAPATPGAKQYRELAREVIERTS